jgi:hypothetical protein
MTSDFFDQEFYYIHNSLGLRGANLTPYDLGKPLIFLYGGSTTYDYLVTQGDTWPERLQRELNNKFTTLNFGAPGHSTTEHLIHTAFYQGIIGKKPVCAAYYVGWNDISKAYIKNLDPAYVGVYPSTLSRQPQLTRYSPLLRVIYAAIQRALGIPNAPNLYQATPGTGTDPRLEDLFVEHVKTIAAINDSRGIRTIFIGQMFNRDLLRTLPELPGRWLPLVKDKDIWPLQQRYNSILEQASNSSSAKYIDPGIDNFTVSDFADIGHFSSAGSKKFAKLVASDIDRYCN